MHNDSGDQFGHKNRREPGGATCTGAGGANAAGARRLKLNSSGEEDSKVGRSAGGLREGRGGLVKRKGQSLSFQSRAWAGVTSLNLDSTSLNPSLHSGVQWRNPNKSVGFPRTYFFDCYKRALISASCGRSRFGKKR